MITEASAGDPKQAVTPLPPTSNPDHRYQCVDAIESVTSKSTSEMPREQGPRLGQPVLNAIPVPGNGPRVTLRVELWYLQNKSYDGDGSKSELMLRCLGCRVR